MTARWRAILLCLVAAVVATSALYRSWPTPGSGQVSQSISDRSHFRELPGWPASRWTIESLRDLFRRAPKAGSSRAESPLDDISGEVAELLYRRVCVDDVNGYVEWRLSRGYSFMPIGRRQQRDLELDWPVFFREPFPDPAPPVREVFTRVWHAAIEYGDGYNKPVAVSGDERGLVLTFQRRTSIEQDRFRLDGPGGWKAWHGTSTGALRNWFVPPLTDVQLIERDGFVDSAAFAVIILYKDGSRRPVSFEFIHIPEFRRWYLLNAKTHGFQPGTPLSGMEL